ncbi:MAG: hypothetical protein EXR00_00385 [Alphaproteobacteria bacterium]|nr:hypothetical protein [Alphaproteobacteria bacterium]
MGHGFSRIGLAVAIAGASLIALSAAEAAPYRLTYNVRHSTYGGIGTYTNIIDKVGNTTTVKTEGRIRVGLAGIYLYRQDADRTERWVGDRLVAFQGTTKTNDNPVLAVSGAAQGDSFVVTSESGTYSAPAGVRPANPWSAEVLKGNTLFTPDRGRIEQVQVSGGQEESVSVDGADMRAKHYNIDRGGGRKYEVWLDGQGTVVKFALVNTNNTISFTLDR